MDGSGSSPLVLAVAARRSMAEGLAVGRVKVRVARREVPVSTTKPEGKARKPRAKLGPGGARESRAASARPDASLVPFLPGSCSASYQRFRAVTVCVAGLIAEPEPEAAADSAGPRNSAVTAFRTAHTDSCARVCMFLCMRVCRKTFDGTWWVKAYLTSNTEGLCLSSWGKRQGK